MTMSMMNMLTIMLAILAFIILLITVGDDDVCDDVYDLGTAHDRGGIDDLCDKDDNDDVGDDAMVPGILAMSMLMILLAMLALVILLVFL